MQLLRYVFRVFSLLSSFLTVPYAITTLRIYDNTLYYLSFKAGFLLLSVATVFNIFKYSFFFVVIEYFFVVFMSCMLFCLRRFMAEASEKSDLDKIALYLEMIYDHQGNIEFLKENILMFIVYLIVPSIIYAYRIFLEKRSLNRKNLKQFNL